MKIASKNGFLFAPMLFCTIARADVKMASLFTDNMVLQRDMSIPVFGTADAGESVMVKLGDTNIARTRADAGGKWLVRLAPQSVATGLTLSVQGKNALVFKNVALGEVWLASGQSNMEFKVSQAQNADAESASANFPDIRSFNVVKNATTTPQSSAKGTWQVCTPETVKNFSAVGYFFGRELHQKLGVPIGIIHSSWGGSVGEAWMSREVLEGDARLKGLMEYTDRAIAETPAAIEKYQKETLPAYEAAAATAKAEGKPAPTAPRIPTALNQYRAAVLYNGMIAPLIPYGIKGAIWYQGESNTNAGQPEQYRTLFPALIGDWRARFGQGDFPFYWVQLANYQGVQKAPVEPNAWPMLREAQSLTLKLPRTGQALAIDLAIKEHPENIHPTNKQDVGHRLALLALNREYGQKTVDTGPTFAAMSVAGQKVRLSFTNAEGLKISGEKPQGLAICGNDGVWKWADASIEGNQVVLSNPEVMAPVAVRYDWAINPIGNLYNGAGLPMVPFRTDTSAAK